jgi:protein TonB
MKYLLSTLFFLIAFSCFSQVTPPPPPPPPVPLIESREVFKVVEEMPRFPGCEDQNLKKRELQDCASDKMLNYISTNLVYPTQAKNDNIEGMAVVQFNIEKNGTLQNIKIVRNPGSGTGEAAAEVIHKMNHDGILWIPGKQRGRTVVVQYTLPVRFALGKQK